MSSGEAFAAFEALSALPTEEADPPEFGSVIQSLFDLLDTDDSPAVAATSALSLLPDGSGGSAQHEMTLAFAPQSSTSSIATTSLTQKQPPKKARKTYKQLGDDFRNAQLTTKTTLPRTGEPREFITCAAAEEYVNNLCLESGSEGATRGQVVAPKSKWPGYVMKCRLCNAGARSTRCPVLFKVLIQGSTVRVMQLVDGDGNYVQHEHDDSRCAVSKLQLKTDVDVSLKPSHKSWLRKNILESDSHPTFAMQGLAAWNMMIANSVPNAENVSSGSVNRFLYEQRKKVLGDQDLYTFGQLGTFVAQNLMFDPEDGVDAFHADFDTTGK
jgi:hypothetical protein